MKPVLDPFKIVSFLLLGLMCQSRALAQTELEVPRIKQEQSLWCWAACAQMIMQFEGADPAKVAQCIQAKDRYEASCCDDPLPKGCDDEGGWPNFQLYGFECKTNQGTALSFQQIQEQIDNKMAVAFSWHFEGDGGHMMVVAGYKVKNGKQYVLVLDPIKNPAEHRWIAGWKSYDFYKEGGQQNSYAHWDDFYDVTPRHP
jgi:hypothetical protein